MGLFNLGNAKNIESGLAEELLIAPRDWFAEIKKPTPPFLENGDSVSVYEDHIFKTGKGFIKAKLSAGKNQLSTDVQGDTGHKVVTQTLEVFLPGSYPVQHGTMEYLKNIPVIALIKDGNCAENFYYQIGTDCKGAWLLPNFKTGTENEGTKGYTATISYINNFVQCYFGDAPILDDGISNRFAVFIAGGNGTDESYAALRRAYDPRNTNMRLIYNYIFNKAGNDILTLSVANDKGFAESETLTEVPLDSYEDFFGFVENWLLVNGNGQQLKENNGQYVLNDPASKNSLMCIKVPYDLWGANGGVLELGGSLIIL